MDNGLIFPYPCGPQGPRPVILSPPEPLDAFGRWWVVGR